MASRAKSRTLTNHQEIRRWAEERGARPSAVRRTRGDDNTGIIRLDFPGYSGENSLEEISWDEWFEDFDDRNLALIVQDETAEGEPSNFNKLVSRESMQDSSEETSQRKRSRGTSARRTSSRRSGPQSDRKMRTARASSRSTSSRSRTKKKTAGERNHRSSRRKAA
jgi:hypothetical protein